MKPKTKRTLCKPVKPKTVAELIETLTTSNVNSLNPELTSDLRQLVCSSLEDFQHAMRSLVMQLKRPHSQIRLGALNVITSLTSPHIDPPSRLKDNATEVAYQFRDKLILQLQDIIPFLLPTTNADKPLPPPKSASDALQRQTLELLLLWERDSEGPHWRPSSRIKGQLTSVMRYLRTPYRSVGISPRLREVSQLLSNIVQAREAEAVQRQRKEQTTNAILRRRLVETRDKYLDQKSMIEENLTSLESILRILVPDLFEDLGSGGETSKSTSQSISCLDPREHGILFGTSSGFGAYFSCGNIASFSMEVSSPSSSSSTVAQQGNDSEARIPRVRLQLSDDVRLLRDSGQEFVDLAIRKHRPVLAAYYEMSRICSSNASLAFALTDQPIVSSLLGRMDRLTSKFCHGLIFEDPNNPNSAGHVADKVEIMSCSDSSTDDDEQAGFVEVPSLIDNLPISTASSSCHANKPLSKRVTRLSDKLPWETNSTAPPTLPLAPRTFASSGAIPAKHKNKNFEANPVSPAASRLRKLETRYDVPILSLGEEDFRHWRAEDTQHRFWKPIDVSEYQQPETDYIEDVISFGGSRHLDPPVAAVPPAQDIHSPLDPVGDQKTMSVNEEMQVEPLACWTPLPQSGRLCPRRDPSGRCRIHGTIFRRHPNTGELADAQTATLRLAAEQRKHTLAEQKKKKKRRRYPELEDISLTQTAEVAKRLRNRLKHPKNLRKLADKLDDRDRRLRDKMFTDSFHRTFTR